GATGRGDDEVFAEVLSRRPVVSSGGGVTDVPDTHALWKSRFGLRPCVLPHGTRSGRMSVDRRPERHRVRSGRRTTRGSSGFGSGGNDDIDQNAFVWRPRGGNSASA